VGKLKIISFTAAAMVLGLERRVVLGDAYAGPNGEPKQDLTIEGLNADDARAILVRLTIEYVKKARGTLTSECTIEPPATSERREVPVAAVIRDGSGEVVAKAEARWLVGPANGK